MNNTNISLQSKTSRTTRTSITSRTSKSLRFRSYHDYYSVPSCYFLHELRRCFEEADVQKKDCLNLDQWMNSSLRNFIQDGKLNDEDYKKYFLRIDANNDGIIDWNELVLYLYKEIEVRELRIDNGAARILHKQKLQPPNRSQMHREMVQHVSICYFTGEYVTMSPDSIRFWSPIDLSYKRSITEPGFFSNFCVFDSLRLIAVATSKRQLLFYELESLTRLPVEVSASPTSQNIRKMNINEAKQTLQLLNGTQMPLANVPQTICSADSLNKPNDYTKIFFVGDDSGVIEVFKIKIPMRRRGTDYLISRISRTVMHQGGVNQISPIDTLKCYASCSMDNTVKFWNFIDSMSGMGGTFSILRTFTDNLGPILGFNFSPSQKIIVTFGNSRDAIVWAVSPPRKLFKLGGHYNAIQSITDFITSNDEKYVLTMTNRKEFRLWDGVNFRMVHEWNDNDLQRPENHFSASFFDLSRHSLITCSSYPSKWTEDVSSQADECETLTHGYPIVGTFYTTAFDEIVTIDCISTMKIWNWKNGTLECAHKNGFDKSELNDKQNSETLSDACIDCSGRRIVTTSFNRRTFLWNFNSGTDMPIHSLTEPSSFVTVMKCMRINCREYYARACWDKNVMLFIENERGVFDPYRVFSGHKSDISAMTEFSEGLITGDVDGELFEWILETNAPKEKTKFDASVECLKTIGHFLFVGDGNGGLHVFSLPKLIRILKIPNAHGLKKPYILSAIEIDSINGFLYTGDTFGYVKKWKLSFDPVFKLEPYLPGFDSLKRCSNEEIKTILVIGNGRFIATECNDLTVRFWVTSINPSEEAELILGYLGFFSDINHSKSKNNSNTGWDVFNIESSLKNDPFHADPEHFKEKSSTNIVKPLINQGNILQSPQIRLNDSVNEQKQQSPKNEIKEIEVVNETNEDSTNNENSIVNTNDSNNDNSNQNDNQQEEAFSFTNAGKIIDNFMIDEEYKKNRPVLSPEVTELLKNGGDIIPRENNAVFDITQPFKPFKPKQLQTTSRPLDIINSYQSLRKRPVPTLSDLNNSYSGGKSFKKLSNVSVNTARNNSHISALTRPIHKPRTSQGTRTKMSANNRVQFTSIIE